MQEDGGFVKLYRSLLDWEWYDDINTKVVFLHILLKANWKETKWHGETIKAGEYRTTLRQLSEELNLSVKSVRTALNHLEEASEVAIKITSKNRIISIKNGSRFLEGGKQRANEGQTKGKQRANNVSLYREEGKESKNSKKREGGEAAAPSLDEIRAYFLEKNYNSNAEIFFGYYDAVGWKRHGQPVTNWRSLADNWERRERKKPKPEAEAPKESYTSFDVDEVWKLGVLTEE